MEPSHHRPLLLSAAQGNRQAVVSLLAAHYPLVWRVSHGLCGESAAPGLTKKILQQSLLALNRWQNELQAEDWFLHHTVLESRHVAPADVTWSWAAGREPPTLAFFKAFLSLPFQQREVFLLCHGEQLQPRRIAVAMDCSNTAAANHLHAATAALQRLAGGDYAPLLTALIKEYRTPPPPGDLAIADTAAIAARRAWRWRIFKTIVWLLLAAAAGTGWWIYQKFKG